MSPDRPVPVIDRLTGLPLHGQVEPAILLLTRDPEGYPHVCLLSRAQLDAVSSDVVAAVVTSRRTRRNLVERPVATLVVVADTAAYYLKLDVDATYDAGWALGLRLRLDQVRADAAPGGLTPLAYVPTPEHEAAERWSDCSALLQRLRSGRDDRSSDAKP